MTALSEAIRTLENLEGELPDLDKDQLESRIGDIICEVEQAEGAPASELADALTTIKDSLQELYNQV